MVQSSNNIVLVVFAVKECRVFLNSTWNKLFSIYLSIIRKPGPNLSNLWACSVLANLCVIVRTVLLSFEFLWPFKGRKIIQCSYSVKSCAMCFELGAGHLLTCKLGTVFAWRKCEDELKWRVRKERSLQLIIVCRNIYRYHYASLDLWLKDDSVNQ